MLSSLVTTSGPWSYLIADAVKAALNVYDLSLLHERVKDEDGQNQDDQALPKRFGLYLMAEPTRIYRELVKDVVVPLVGEPIVYQAVPTWRVQVPSGFAVNRYHRDVDYGHAPEEINFWVPLTPITAETAVWAESAMGMDDYRPLLVQPGQMLVFDGALLRHGNRMNTTERTRVSFDFRVIPTRLYRDHGHKTVNVGRELRLGDYFAELEPPA